MTTNYIFTILTLALDIHRFITSSTTISKAITGYYVTEGQILAFISHEVSPILHNRMSQYKYILGYPTKPNIPNPT